MIKDKETLITWLRRAMLLGAFLDGLAVLPFLFPDAARLLLGVHEMQLTNEYFFAAYMAASLMAGWALLLYWASNDPLARYGVLIITIFPVVTGLIASEAWGLTTGKLSKANVIPLMAVQAVLSIVYIWLYMKARAFSTSS